MQRHIFDPLGMSSTAFDASGVPAGALAVGYERDGDGPYHPIRKQREGGAMEPCGGLYSTVDDLAKYAAFELGAWAGRHSDVLSARSLRESHTPSAIPLSAGAVVGVNWIIDRSRLGRSIWHNGGIDGYSSLLAMYPNRDAAVIVLVGGDAGGMGTELEAAADDVLQSWEPALDVPLGPEMQAAFHRLIDLVNQPSAEKFAATFSEDMRAFLLKPPGGYESFVTRLHNWFRGGCQDSGVTTVGGVSSATVWYTCKETRTAMTVWLDPATWLISGWRWEP
jgi:CubicO group peptidase (beta-lactamase class C family)